MDNERLKILLIDDDDIQHSIAKNMLSDEYDILSAKSGYEALGHLYNNDYLPNLILLDILMPEMDGWEVFNRIRAISFLRKVPIVFVTSVTEATEKNRALEMGAVDFINKPYEREDLVGSIKKILV